MSRPTTAVGYAEMFRSLDIRADGWSSIELPDERVLWMLGDTRFRGVIYRNFFVVQDGDQLTVLPELIPNDGSAWYWPNQAVIEGSNLRVFATRFEEGPVSAGTQIFTFNPSTLALTATSASINDTWTEPDGWGGGVFQGATNTYIYAATGSGFARNQYCAYVVNGSVTNIASWTYLGLTATSVGSQFSVYEEGKALTKFNIDTALERWEASDSTFASGLTRTDIAQFEAENSCSTYFPMTHPWAALDSGKMLASLAQNCGGFNVRYFPMFLEIDNAVGVQPTRRLTARASGGEGYVYGHGIEANRGTDDFDYPEGSGITVTYSGEDFRGWDGDSGDTTLWHAVDLSEDQDVTGAFGLGFGVVQEPPPDRVNVVVLPSALAGQRWGADEAISDNVIDSLSFSDEMPGGDKELSAQLARSPSFQWPDLEAYSRVLAHGAGGEVLWEGSLQSAPEASGDQLSISPAAVGDQDLLGDENKIVTALIVDRDLAGWQGISRELRVALLDGSAVSLSPGEVASIADHSADSDEATGLPALVLRPTAPATAGVTLGWSQANYDAGPGLTVGSVYYDATEEQITDTAIGGGIRFSDGTDVTDVATLTPINPPVAEYFTTGSDRWVYIVAQATGIAATEDHELALLLRKVAVYGDHGLTGQGSDPEGFYAADIFTYLIETFAPAPLTVGGAEDDGFIIPHAVWREGTTLAEMIREISRYGLLDWFVRNRKAYLYTRGDSAYSRSWRVRIREGELQETGMDAARLWRSVVVRFQDVSGESRTIGPVGAPVDEESADLEITDPNHPAVIADRTRRDVLELGGVSTFAIAEQIGIRFLEEANRLSRAGSATVRGYIEDSTGCLRPVSEIRSGDEITFLNASDPSPRRIVGRSYNHGDRAAQLDLDAPPQALEALLERIGAKLGALGLT